MKKVSVRVGFLFVALFSLFALVKLGSNFIHYALATDVLQLERPITQNLKLDETTVLDLYGTGFEKDMTINLVMDATENLAVIKAYPLEGVFNESLINNDTLYLGSNKDGLKVISLAEPEHPRLIGEYQAGKPITDIHLKGDQLFLSCGWLGVVVMQVLPNGLLTYQTEIKTDSAALKTRFVNGVLTVATRQDGLLFYDISRTEDVFLVNRLNVETPVTDIEEYHGYLYVLSQRKSLEIYKITEFHEVVKITEKGFENGLNDISVFQDCLYLTTSRGILQYELNDPAEPIFQKKMEGSGSADRIFFGSRNIYITDSFSQLSAIDLKLINKKKQIFLTSDVRTVAEMGAYLYVAGSNSGLLVLDRQKLSAQPRWAFNTPGSVHDIFIKEHFLYIADERSGILLKDLNKDDDSYTQISSRWGQSFCADSDNNLLFVALGRSGIEVFDISAPGQPKSIAVWPGFESWRLAVAGDYLISAKGINGLELIDISDRFQPVIKMSIPDVHVLDIVFDNHLLYVASKLSGLQLYKINTEGQLKLVSTISVPFPMNQFAHSVSVAVKNDVAYVANGRSGLLIVDVKRPRLPETLSSLDIPGFSKTIKLKGEKVFVGSQHGGISVVNVKNPNKPRYESYLVVQGLSRGVQIVDDLIYVAQKNVGVTALPVPLPVKRIDMISSQHVRADLPHVRYRGKYGLQVNNRFGSVTHDGVISYR